MIREAARVSRIRAAQREDLEQVTALYERTMRSGSDVAAPGLADYFKRTLFDYPWADPEIPSLVYETGDDRILGFQGSHVRRLLIDERPIRMGCAGQLITDPRHRQLAVGAQLMRTYLSGPQELTVTDGGSDVVHRMWAGLGGAARHPASIGWMCLFRPLRALSDLWLEHRGKTRWRRLVRPLSTVLDPPFRPLTRPPARPAGIHAEDLTPQLLIQSQPEVLGKTRLRVDYDERYLDWLFREMAAVSTRGTLVRRLLFDERGPVGWYVGYLKRRGMSRVMAIQAPKKKLGTVLDYALADAWEAGSSALEGRLEPSLYDPLSSRHCWLHYTARALLHCDDADVLAALSLGSSALTRLDGEYWMGHHIEPLE